MNCAIIAISNHKGGVGKTTSVACLGLALAREGKKTLLVDLDGQMNLTGFFINEDEVETSIYDSMTKGTPLPVISIKDNLDMVPASMDLARVDIDLAGRIARERILSDLLEPLAEKYDFILLDCPPSLGIMTANALVASTEIVVPLQGEALPLKGLRMIEDLTEELGHAMRREIGIDGIFITRFNNRKINKEVASAIRSKYGVKVYDTVIRENIALAEVPLYGGDIFDYAPESNGAKDYQELAKEIIKSRK